VSCGDIGGYDHPVGTRSSIGADCNGADNRVAPGDQVGTATMPSAINGGITGKIFIVS
jgi:hypothetical protein